MSAGTPTSAATRRKQDEGRAPVAADHVREAPDVPEPDGHADHRGQRAEARGEGLPPAHSEIVPVGSVPVSASAPGERLERPGQRRRGCRRSGREPDGGPARGGEDPADARRLARPRGVRAGGTRWRGVRSVRPAGPIRVRPRAVPSSTRRPASSRVHAAMRRRPDLADATPCPHARRRRLQDRRCAQLEAAGAGGPVEARRVEGERVLPSRTIPSRPAAGGRRDRGVPRRTRSPGSPSGT